MLKLAIYGLGRWGARLVDSVKDSAHVRFVTAITRDPGKRASIALTNSYAQVLADPQIDGVVLATPHSQHANQIIEAAHAGKHVFVEKPFTLTRASAQTAIDACRDAGVTLGVGFNRRYAPAYVEMMRRIGAGAIGDVVHVEGQFSGSNGYNLKPGIWRALREESPGGAMTSRGVHALDCMIGIAGLVGSVTAFSERRTLAVDVDDVTVALLRFTGGVTGYLASLHATGDMSRIQAYGSKGWLEMRSDTELAARNLNGAVEIETFSPVDKERAELEDFAAAVAARKPFVAPAEEIVNGVAVLEAIVASAGNSVQL
jgi:predicted dehydrogenase